MKTILQFDNTNPLTDIASLVQLHQNSTNETDGIFPSNGDYEFYQKYVLNKTIDYYLTNASLKDELNMCFGSKNIQKICKLWLFIHDLLKQLPGSKKPVTLYRGQYLATQEIQEIRNNTGGFMQYFKFFSMSTSNILAICRREEDYLHLHPESVLFQLKINDSYTNTRFGLVTQTNEEKTFLFAPGSIFRIESVEKLSDHTWCCKLCLSNADENKLTSTFQHYEKEIGTALTFLSLGIYLSEIGQVDEAITYFQTLLSVSKDPDITSAILNNLAIISTCKDDPAVARSQLEQALKLQTSDTHTTSTVTLLSPKKTLDMMLAQPIPSTLPIINYYNLACIHRDLERFDEALKECEKALKSTKTEINSTHTALVYGAMGSVYYAREDHGNALKYFRMALDVALIHLPSTDPLIYQYLNNIRILSNNIKSTLS
ncbi:unnamed protein product [Adineta steineri]|uniref:Uncharacterized protein n=1 Tax=Adineta steineri TaxID=433720 RepID=A0A815R6N5_9BILA|nr:unnamed protein product [Adineta steineri]CAF1471230.1 unnamed protein product [Adineta steineri]